MSKIKLGCHVGMAGKEMFLASAKEAASYGANVLSQRHMSSQLNSLKKR